VHEITVSIDLERTHRQALLTHDSVRKPEKEEQFDSQVVAAVEAKLRAMDVDDSPASAAEAT
jgi:hypothetical protein